MEFHVVRIFDLHRPLFPGCLVLLNPTCCISGRPTTLIRYSTYNFQLGMARNFLLCVAIVAMSSVIHLNC